LLPCIQRAVILAISFCRTAHAPLARWGTIVSMALIRFVSSVPLPTPRQPSALPQLTIAQCVSRVFFPFFCVVVCLFVCLFIYSFIYLLIYLFLFIYFNFIFFLFYYYYYFFLNVALVDL
jgi:hypothetical protein